MNAATILACIAFTAMFGVAWLFAEAWARYRKRLAQRPRPVIEWRCASCDKDMGINPRPNQTHGFCQMHFEKQMAEVWQVPDACVVEPPF